MFFDANIVADAGTQAWLYGGDNTNGTREGFVSRLSSDWQIDTFPTADYNIDGSPGEPLAENTAYQGAHLFSLYSQFLKPIRGQHGEGHLLPDTGFNRRHPQGRHRSEVGQRDKPIHLRLPRRLARWIRFHLI